MLEVENLHAYYGKSHVLHGVNFTVGEGEVVSLLGRNGSGRSTTAKAIMGLVQAKGTVRWRGQSLLGKPPHEIARLGVGYVPENKDVFPRLTVHQNLMLGQKGSATRTRWDFDDMYALFPRLRERQHVPAGVLSGGEQQMLTLCRTLMGEPALMLIDEPTEGLAPQVVEQVAAFLLTLKTERMSMVLIDQKLSFALAISDRILVMGHGEVVFNGSPQAFDQHPEIRHEWLEL
ncbi:LivF ABC-type branched-chain amino acid transport systems, ATPase component [Burkholderiaceae bacterium]